MKYGLDICPECKVDAYRKMWFDKCDPPQGTHESGSWKYTCLICHVVHETDLSIKIKQKTLWQKIFGGK